MLQRDYQAVLARARQLPANGLVTQGAIVPRPLLLARAYSGLERVGEARTSYLEARDALIAEIARRPNDHRLYAALGIAYAGLGVREDAINAARRGAELLPVSSDAFFGWLRVLDLARVYAATGQIDAAFAELEGVLEAPSSFTGHDLRLDPAWDPLRSHPRYAVLLKRYGG